DLWRARGLVVYAAADYPVGALRFLRERGTRGNLALPLDWGSYALWQVAPAVRVSLDGRFATVYPPAVVEDNFAFFRGDGGANAGRLPDPYAPPWCWCRRGSPRRSIAARAGSCSTPTRSRRCGRRAASAPRRRATHRTDGSRSRNDLLNEWFVELLIGRELNSDGRRVPAQSTIQQIVLHHLVSPGAGLGSAAHTSAGTRAMSS